MSPLAIVLLAFTMSIDSHLAAVGWGAARPRIATGEVIATGLLFSVVQMATPLIGWGLGSVASAYVAPVDHWIAFVLLGFVGGHMIYVAWHEDGCCKPAPLTVTTMTTLVMTAIGTSIDAMAVGISLAFLDVDIIAVTLAIGIATFVMAALGLVMGRALSCRFGRCAEMLAGGVLIGLGVLILFKHLMQ